MEQVTRARPRRRRIYKPWRVSWSAYRNTRKRLVKGGAVLFADRAPAEAHAATLRAVGRPDVALAHVDRGGWVTPIELAGGEP